MHCHNLKQFGEWVKWGNMMEPDPNWQKIVREDNDALLKFQIAALEDALPTPSILWGVWHVKEMTQEKTKCQVCGDNDKEQCSLSHILSSCNNKKGSEFSQGRYTWRHDSILLALYQGIRTLRN